MKALISILSTILTWLYFVEPSRGFEQLSITGCMFFFVFCTMFFIILSVQKSLNDEDGFRGPGLFLYTFSTPFLWISSSLFVFHSIFYFFCRVSIFKTTLSLWWCIILVTIIQNIIRSFDLLFLLNCCRIFGFFDVFSFIIFSISMCLSSICSIFVLTLSYQFHLCLIVVTSTLQFIVIIYVIPTYESISKKRFFTSIWFVVKYLQQSILFTQISKFSFWS